MNTVSLVRPEVNPATPIQAVIEWADKQADKGDMGGASARLRVTSLRQVAEQVATDEPDDARWILENIERLRDRWARKHLDGKSGTARTYASRAKTTIEEYFRWAESPGTYDPKRSPTRTTDKKPEKATKPAATSDATETPAATPPVPRAANTAQGLPMGELRNCPLGQGREPFRYILPSDGFQVRDAMRIAFHLITTCDDYDPTMSPMQVVSSAMQRQP